MAKDFVQIYNNFLKYEKDKAGSEMPEKPKSRGLLSPKSMKKKKIEGAGQMDTVMKYVEEIRKYRNGN